MGPQGDVITSTWRARKGWRSFQVTDPLEGSGGAEGYFQHIPLSHWAQNIAKKRAALLGIETGSRWGGGAIPRSCSYRSDSGAGTGVEAQLLTRAGVLPPFPLWL